MGHVDGHVRIDRPPGRVPLRPRGGDRVSAARGPILPGRAPIIERSVRSVPIRSRILAIAVLNSAVALALLAIVWGGAQVLRDAWSDLVRVQQSERFLSSVSADAERLQSLIHRYFAQSEPDILARIVDLRETLVGQLRVQARLDPLIAGPARELTEITERFVQGFDDLRETRAGISTVYETKILRPAREMGGLYVIIASRSQEPGSGITPALGQSREAFNEALLAANAFYLSGAPGSAREAIASAEVIKRTAPVMIDLAREDTQRRALEKLADRADLLGEGVNDLGIWFSAQNRLLREAVDGNAEKMTSAIDRLKGGIHELQRSAQTRFDQTLQDRVLKLGILTAAFVALVVLMGIGIAKSISDPLRDLRSDMMQVMSGRLDRPPGGREAGDEIGEMARAVDVFRETAIAREQAEIDLRAAKERAETNLAEIREMQTSLIEAEKLAALGGLVAGVAHEVNNPVGISLTVASSLASRSDSFAAEMATGQIRRSALEDFTAATRTAAGQLVANLQRAGELIQSFKQVAVDRSQAERRSFDLREATDQIFASLRPSLKSSRVRLVVDIPAGITMNSFPGPLGQILTNLLLNSVNHGFADGREGTISITARLSGAKQVRIVFRDDGTGMSEEVQRQAFDPFFTTRRGNGGTGLGLHIVYNLVTQRLGGRIVLSSAEGSGTSFLLALPLSAPAEEARVSGASAAPLRFEEAHVAS